MKKFLIIICGIFMIFSAFATGENIPTSKSYVDAEIATKQDKIAANDGAAQVLMNTGTAGEYGTKNIYDSTGSYATQTDALIDAVTMNTAVQNAIDSEFQCVEYNPNDPTDCWLMQLGGITQVPSGYTQLEYLESTGTQWLDTGIAPNNSTGLKVKFNKKTTGDQVVVGTDVGGNNVGRLYVNPAGTIFAPFAEHYSYARIGTTVLNTDYDVQVNYTNDRKRYLNGISVLDINKTLTGPSSTMFLFAGRHSSGPNWYFKGKVYYLKITDGIRTVRNMVPARRDNDGVLGMYDTVSNTFFTNAGTGDFIPGPIVYIPAGN